MPNQTYKIDQGNEFGKWTDKISKLMYFETTKNILKLIDIPDKVADYGGANGNLKLFIPNSITIDIDNSKNPDITDNIITHKGKYDLIIIRFVLHYLTDYELLQFFTNLQSYHKGKVLIIQFCNEDLKTKYFNSINEKKYFRCKNQLEKLLPENRVKIFSKEYNCSKLFYKNRLGNKNAKAHKEIINAYLINYEYN